MPAPVAMVAAVARAPPMPMPRVMRLLDDHLLLILAPADQVRKERRDDEEQAVHDPQRKAALQQVARLGRVDRVHAVRRRERDRPEGVGARGRARLAPNEAQLVDAADQRADEAQVDEGDEPRVRVRAVVREERVDGPAGAEDGDDEEHEDVCGREGIVADIYVD